MADTSDQHAPAFLPIIKFPPFQPPPIKPSSLLSSSHHITLFFSLSTKFSLLTCQMAEVMYNEKKRFRDESADDSFPEAKRIRDDLLDILDDTEPADANQDLASVMKSFEEEISSSIPVTSDSGESQPDLGYLFGASDDELGLPPAFSGSSVEATNESEQQDENDVIGVPSVPLGYEHIWRFEDDIPSYDFGIGDENSNNGDFLALDGLFDYSDTLYSGQSDYSEFLYRPESLSAL